MCIMTKVKNQVIYPETNAKKAIRKEQKKIKKRYEV